ncbi:MAG: bifunctional 5,10-methylenetetrahydrofolate dehydrogenase/5,10-methenyltetrahydrofolate cyclohydrolase [Candidatus Niyogibacteria bacterium]|nr:bifunctional 5,10-methylenetetrahydrofolate dehydrogenase/5,10-methenyltetrahydrofolate cyclohydrolase [Candidatus Niyogibacteria bacterium]
MAILLDGKKLADEILDDLKMKIAALPRKPKLLIFFIASGEEKVDTPTLNFIHQKSRSAEKIGIEVGIQEFGYIGKEELEKEVKKAGDNPDVDGIIVQLPIPGLSYQDRQKVLNCIPVEKDVDVLSGKAMGEDFRHMNEMVWPPPVSAVRRIFEAYKIDYKKKRIVIAGRGKLIGSAIDTWFKRPDEDVGPIVITKNTPNPAELYRIADIIIAGIPDAPNVITGDMVKEGVIVIDAGNFRVDGKLVGNVDFESVSKKASYITPVPDGVGPLLVAYVLFNVYLLAKRRQQSL